MDNISTGKAINSSYKFFFERKLQLYYDQECISKKCFKVILVRRKRLSPIISILNKLESADIWTTHLSLHVFRELKEYRVEWLKYITMKINKCHMF